MILADVRGRRAFVTGGLSVPRLRLRAYVEFLIDTGASQTMVHPSDAMQLRVNFDEDFQNRAPSSMPGIGGTATEHSERCELEFQHEDGNIDIIEADVSFALPTSYNVGYPSLLGTDVIRLYKLTYHLAENLVTLE
jgi:hypothetical protein